MSKNEIRLRRQKLTSRGAERFRNYGAVLERHEKEVRLKKIIRAFSMFLIILIVIVLLVIIVRIEKRATKKKATLNERVDKVSLATDYTTFHGLKSFMENESV